MKTAVFVVFSLVLFACAEAGTAEGPPGGGPDAAVEGPDADLPPPGSPDANPFPPPTPDASPLPPPADAAPPPPPPIDAGTGGGIVCESNADCPAADDCCFIALCVPGTEAGDLCFPD